MLDVLARRSRLLAFSTVFLLAGCAGEFVRMAPPVDGWREAVSPVAPNARLWADVPPPDADARMAAFSEMLIDRAARAEAAGEEFEFTILALSSGAEDGAYGAGVLVGWTAAGDRPKFDVVTGVSTGAIIAPFAFLGSDYDDDLEVFFTTTSTEDLLEPALFSALVGDALGLTDVSGFEQTIAEAITPQFMAAVAREHQAGRRLFIATTNLDARRPVIWDMGEIAVRGDAEALTLFRNIIRASASIPGAFPPVFVDVEVDGRRFQELHVDGGVSVTVFAAPNWMRLNGELTEILGGATTIYVIQNNKLDPLYEPIEGRLTAIAGASISEMIRAQARGDQLRIFALAERNNFEYRVTAVPTDFDVESSELFDPVYMSALYRVGFDVGVSGTWLNEPTDLPAAPLGASGQYAADQ